MLTNGPVASVVAPTAVTVPTLTVEVDETGGVANPKGAVESLTSEVGLDEKQNKQRLLMAILDRRKDRFVDDQDQRVSVGIEFPFGRVGGGDGYFKSTKTTIESIKNNIKLLYKLIKGERVFQPNLGMNLRRLMFEQMTEEITIQIENNIVDVFQKWLPFVR